MKTHKACHIWYDKRWPCRSISQHFASGAHSQTVREPQIVELKVSELQIN